MIHSSRWRLAPCAFLAFALAGCGGGGSDGAADTSAASETVAARNAVATEKAVAIDSARAPLPADLSMLAYGAPDIPGDPEAPRLTVDNGQFNIRTRPGLQVVFEDPDGSGPLPERQITQPADGPVLALPPATDLARVLQAHYRVAGCQKIQKLVYRNYGWVRVPRIVSEVKCDGASSSVRLDAPAIANTFAVSMKAKAYSADGAQAAFAIQDAQCVKIHVIDSRGERDRVTSMDLATTGDCSATDISLAMASNRQLVAIGMPQALNTQGQSTGVVQLRAFDGQAWQPAARLAGTGEHPGDSFGSTVSLSADAQRLVVSAPNASSETHQLAGAVYLFEAGAQAGDWVAAQVWRGEQPGTRLGLLLTTISAPGDQITTTGFTVPPTARSPNEEALCRDTQRLIQAGILNPNALPPFCATALLEVRVYRLEQGVWQARVPGA